MSEPRFWKNQMLPGKPLDIREAMHNAIQQMDKELDRPDYWNPPCQKCGRRGTFVLCYLPVENCWHCTREQQTQE